MACHLGVERGVSGVETRRGDTVAVTQINGVMNCVEPDAVCPSPPTSHSTSPSTVTDIQLDAVAATRIKTY